MRTVGAAGLLMVLAAWPAAAADMPARKPGLWEIKMNFENRNVPGQSIQQCIDAATDAIMQSSASNIGSQNCSKRDVVKSGDTMTINSVCTVAGKNATSHAVVTGSFDSAYTMTVVLEERRRPRLQHDDHQPSGSAPARRTRSPAT